MTGRAAHRRGAPERISPALYLKEIYLSGFKSFAEPTTVQLAPSFTAVVGPNGTGKSSLTEAVRWALSSGRSSDQRLENREEVLFAGSAQRRAASMCEVRLTFDNGDRLLPLDQSEVEIVRRVYRGGETEYRLQGVTCRARDIERLVAHLGLAEGYAWIGQGRVEEVVNQDPAQRRRLLEDAAGASVYRERRREAVLEMAKADHEADLERAHLAEVEAQLPELALDAERAEAAVQLRRRIAELEIALGRRRIERLGQARQRAAGRLEAHLAEEGSSTRATRTGETAMAEVTELASRLTARLGHLDRLSASVAGRLEAYSAQAAAAGERERGALQRHEALSQARERTARETAAVQSQAAAASLRLGNAEDLLRQLGAAGREALRAAAQRPQVEAALAAGTTEATRLEAEAGARQAAAETAETRAAAQAEVLNAREQELQQSRASLQDMRRLEEAARTRSEEAEHALAVLRDQRREAERHAPAAVRTVLAAAGAGRLQGIVGTLGTLVAPREERFALALATALGGQASDLVATDEQAARAAIALLRQTGAGRATFLPLDALTPGDSAQVPRGTSCLGVLGDLCKYPAELAPAVRLRLGRTLVADDLPAAQAVAAATGRRYRVVSLDGQVVQLGGALTGGQAVQRLPRMPSAERLAAAEAEAKSAKAGEDQATAALGQAIAFERKSARARDDAQMELETLAAAALKARQESERLTRQLEAAQAEQTQLRTELERIEALAPSADAGRLQAAALDEALAREELLRLRGELDRLQRDMEQGQSEMEESARRLEAARAEAAASRTRREAAQRWREVIAERRREAQKLESDLRAFERLLERFLRAATGRAAGAAEAIAGLREEVERLELERLSAERQLLAAHGEDALTRKVPALPSGAEEELQQARQRLQGLGGASPEAPARLQEAMRRRTELEERLADLQGAKAALVEVLAAADSAVQQRLAQALDVVGGRFGELAAELFGHGARAGLVPVASGIDLEVQLPGKEAVRLKWLSGGERALSAICFLFALSALRTPPFYLLDEIEASLDERNVERFAQFLRRQQGRQLVVCTHQRPTMEAADQLIGTTMQERGVTRLAGVQLGEDGQGGDLGQVAQGA